MAHATASARTIDAVTGSTANAPASIAPLAHDVPTAAKLIGIGTSMAWALVRQGKIRVTRIGRRTLVPASEIARVVAEGC